MTKKPRAPTAYDIPTEVSKKPHEPNKKRPAKALDPDQDKIIFTEDFLDIDENLLETTSNDPLAADKPRGFSLLKIVLASTTLLIGLGIGLWIDGLISELFERHVWLGWLGSGITFCFVAALIALIISELLTLAKFKSAETLRQTFQDQREQVSLSEAHKLTAKVMQFISKNAETAQGRHALENAKNDVMDGKDYLIHAEKELLKPLDERAKQLISASAKRVSIVTAVSPRALVDTLYIVYEMLRLLRAIASLYGDKPGMFGTVRLIKNVGAQLAVAGTISLGENIAQQFISQGIAAKISTKFGEGVINGLLAARFGVVAMEVTRPMPFHAVSKPKVKDLLKGLKVFDQSQPEKLNN